MKRMVLFILSSVASMLAYADPYAFTQGPAHTYSEGQSSDGTAWATTTTPGSDGSETTVGEDSNGNAWMSVSR